MPIVPDTKDWTWVLERPCPECGFDASSLGPDQVAPLIRVNARAWSLILAERPELLGQRPRPDRWSALEYSCHVRDVFRLNDERLGLMLSADNPTFPNWDQDQTAVDDGYDEQDPMAVASELGSAADALAARFDTVDGAGWDRRGLRSDGAAFSVATFGRYTIHDPVHHLHDVTVDLNGLRYTGR
ncbi:MAG: DinB family protein [Actinomycetota bacterium]|nr:DinB family protein [Actinomycetota bacterium]